MGSLRELDAELERSREASARLMRELARKIGRSSPVRGVGRAARYVGDSGIRDATAGIGRWVRRRPIAAILAAVAIGFLAGRATRPERPISRR